MTTAKLLNTDGRLRLIGYKAKTPESFKEEAFYLDSDGEIRKFLLEKSGDTSDITTPEFKGYDRD